MYVLEKLFVVSTGKQISEQLLVTTYERSERIDSADIEIDRRIPNWQFHVILHCFNFNDDFNVYSLLLQVFMKL